MPSKVNHILLKGMQIYSEGKTIEKGYLKVGNQKILETGTIEELNDEEEYQIIEISNQFKAIPGFIDIHIHGVNGADVMDATEDALKKMAFTLPKEGTTSFLATTMTQETEQIEKALSTA